jgi:predicted nucleic acid-binding Zn ribbon protein
MRRRSPRPISVAIETLTGELAPPSALVKAQTIWAQAVGPEIAGHCEPSFEREGTLTVACDSSVWAAELEMRSGDLLRNINAALRPTEAFASLRFRVR